MRLSSAPVTASPGQKDDRYLSSRLDGPIVKPPILQVDRDAHRRRTPEQTTCQLRVVGAFEIRADRSRIPMSTEPKEVEFARERLLGRSADTFSSEQSFKNSLLKSQLRAIF